MDVTAVSESFANTRDLGLVFNEFEIYASFSVSGIEKCVDPLPRKGSYLEIQTILLDSENTLVILNVSST